MKKCFCLLLTLILILGGCGVPEQESFTEPVISDFSEKPGREVDYVHSHPIGTTVRYDLNGDGVGENITVKAMEYEAGNLAIDGATVEFWSATPTGYFTVLNPDASRNVLLAGVPAKVVKQGVDWSISKIPVGEIAADFQPICGATEDNV